MFKDHSKLQSWCTYIPLFPQLLLSVNELLFLHPCLLQRLLICALLMLHLGGEGGGKEEGERERGRWGGEAGGRKRERGKEGRQEEEGEGGREIGGKARGRVGSGGNSANWYHQI